MSRSFGLLVGKNEVDAAALCSPGPHPLAEIVSSRVLRVSEHPAVAFPVWENGAIARTHKREVAPGHTARAISSIAVSAKPFVDSHYSVRLVKGIEMQSRHAVSE